MKSFFSRQYLKALLQLLVCLLLFTGCSGGDGDGSGTAGSEKAAPEAAFTVSIDSGTAPLSVSFDASESADSDGTITTYAWSFGDGNAGSGSILTHIYQTSGDYTAILTVTDDDGLTGTASRKIAVSESKNTAPEASFTVSTDSGTAPLMVSFDASGSADSDGTLTTYAWSFGDGGTAYGTTTTHTFHAAGDYTVMLTVTDNDDAVATDSRVISVYESGEDPEAGSYTISGTVTSPSHIFVDSDVNDPNSTPVSNNTAADAQSVLAPCSISGYVNVAGAGSRGSSYIKGDTDDFFLVSLIGGMDITLYMAESGRSNEISLYLYSLSGNRLILSESTFTDQNGVASLEVPEDGTYYVRVEAAGYFFIQTATVYTLTMGQTTSMTTQYPLHLTDNFVPGEVLVRFKQETDQDVSPLSDNAVAISAMGFDVKTGGGNRDKLLRKSDTMRDNVFFEKLGIKQALADSIGTENQDTETTSKLKTLWMVRAMRRQEGVAIAEPNFIRKALTVPNDTYYPYQWHYPMIQLPEAWEITQGSSNVVVAVVDTGVLLDHPDMAGQTVDGYDFISDTSISGDGDGVDDNPDDPGDRDGVNGSSSFHGTHVAGTIAAASNNSQGVAGIAWNARIMPLRVLGIGSGTSSDILEAVKYAAGLSTDAGVRLAAPVDIINLSLGGESYSQIEADVYAQARAQGVIIIAAAGNTGTSRKIYPAAYDGVVSVSAVTIDASLAYYSNYGATVDVAAPGGNSSDTNGDGYVDGVLSTSGDDNGDDNGDDIEMTYAFNVGTSMAAPHVSGVAALMKALYPELTPDGFDALLQAGYLTQDIGDSGRDDQFGYGLIDAYKAVQVAREGGTSENIPPILSVSPGSLHFGISLTSETVKVKNGGGGDTGALTISDYYTNASWLSAAPESDVDEYGLGTYTIIATREGLAEGTTYSGSVIFASNAGEAEVAVVMQVASTNGSADGGFHYILLLDPETLETRGQVESAGKDGIYNYSFSNLSHGETYVIYAGTDPNNDGYICDQGEACGAYISLDEPVEITVTGDMEGIDFSTDIKINIPDGLDTQSVADTLRLERIILKQVSP